MIIIFLSIASLLLALVHFVVYKAAVSIFIFSSTWKLILGITLTVLGLSFVLASILTFYFSDCGFTFESEHL